MQRLFKPLAKLCHDINKAYCEGIGDYSVPTWEDTTTEHKQSLVRGIEFYMENPNATPEDIHNNWMKDKSADGWVYGEVKDAEKKTHPCMVPYHSLPQEQRVKDALLKTVVGYRQELNEHFSLFWATVEAQKSLPNKENKDS